VSNLDDPQAEWLPWQAIERRQGEQNLARHEGMFQDKPEGFFDGATVWTEWRGNMGTVHPTKIVELKRSTGEVALDSDRMNWVSAGNRFYVEDAPGLLDEPGEYYYDEATKRLYLRLPGDADPNGAAIEVPTVQHTLRIVDQSHIHVSGLTFRYGNREDYDVPFPGIYNNPGAIYAAGDLRDIAVTNNTFQHVKGVFTAHPRFQESTTKIYTKDLLPWKEDLVTEILIADNDIAYSSDSDSIALGDGGALYKGVEGPRGKLGEVRILRNRLYWTGFRQCAGALSNAAAIELSRPEIGEIAGNFIEQSWGSGIFTFSGAKNFNFDQKVPLTRFFIHHNKVVNAMLATNDWGGIAYWQGGPYYTYNNIAGNVIGHKASVPLKNDWKTVAYNYYLDGTFKSYTFNNIAWSKYNSTDSPYRGRGGYFVVLGYMNHLFNNSFYNFRHGILGSSGNRSTFLGNIVSDITGDFIQQNRPGDTSLRGGGDTGEQGARGMPTNAYGHNVFFGEDNPVGNARGVRGHSIEDWREGLAGINARLSHTGWKAPGSAFEDPDPYGAHDFRPKADAPVDGRGVKFFVPFGLYKMVGEWNFIHHPGNENLILGEHFYMDEAFRHRHMYEDVPRNDLTVHGATADSYVDGALEDWQEGALRFDGESVHAVLKHEDIVGDFEYKQPLTERGQPGRKSDRGTWTEPRETLDMDDNSFLIEAYLRVPATSAFGTIVQKASEGNGYMLGLSEDGSLGIVLADGETRARALSTQPVNDGSWRHLIAEVDRADGVVRFYIDGKLDSETPVELEGSLANESDFLVGKGAAGHLHGDIDFLLLARGTLADAKTTIEELHAWQFEGPFLRDWTGEMPEDGDRDAGAVEK